MSRYGLLTDKELRASPVPVSGTISVTQVTTKEVRSATSAVTQVGDSATSVTLLASNGNRLGAAIYNDSSAILRVKLGAIASTSSFTVALAGNGGGVGDYYEVPVGYTGVIDGIWSSDAGGNALVTEFTA